MAEAITRKHSRQRDAIIALLKNRNDHPTAEQIYKEIRHTIPNISLGTVYRNLTLLSDNGEILRLSFDGKVDHFDGTIQPHYHFVCTQCGCLQDVPLPYDSSLDACAGKVFDGTIKSHSLIFEGLCQDCTMTEAYPE